MAAPRDLGKPRRAKDEGFVDREADMLRRIPEVISVGRGNRLEKRLHRSLSGLDDAVAHLGGTPAVKASHALGGIRKR